MSISLAKNIDYIGLNDYETALFEELWPLPQGIAYNSYLIRDQKTAVVDSVKKNYIPEYIHTIKRLLGDGGKLDYLIINHMEPDHSGAVQALRQVFPDLTIVGNEKTAAYLQAYFGMNRNIKIVQDQEEISLGQHNLKFFLTPMLHWPETMMTYEKTTQTLFSGDAFGAFGALPGGIFDDEVDLKYFESETRRYFSNIIGKYCAMVEKAITRLENLDIQTIAATHGPVYRRNPRYIVDLYARWSRQETEPGAVIVYASMYGHTKQMAEALARGLTDGKIDKIEMFNIAHTHLSTLINEIWQYKALILGSCTYNSRLFPPMEMLLNFLENYKIKNHYLGIFGSYTWSGGALAALKKFAEAGPWECVEPAPEAQGAADQEIFAQCALLGKNCAQKLAQK